MISTKNQNALRAYTNQHAVLSRIAFPSFNEQDMLPILAKRNQTKPTVVCSQSSCTFRNPSSLVDSVFLLKNIRLRIGVDQSIP